MRILLQDLRFGLRTFLKQPGFTAVALLTLAIGIGANTAIFSVVNAVLLKPLPFSDPDRLVAVGSITPKSRGNSPRPMSYPDYADMRTRSTSFSEMAAYSPLDMTLTGTGTPLHLQGFSISAQTFRLLGVKPALGRDFAYEDDGPDGGPNGRLLMLSDATWKKRFGGDPAIVGRSMTVNGQTFTVVGVMPPGFQFPIQARAVEAWTTIGLLGKNTGPEEQSQLAQRGFHFMNAIGRLKPGIAPEQAEAELAGIARQLESNFPDTNTGFGAVAKPFHDSVVGESRATLWVLFGVVSCVLLISCANIANLMLARAVARQKEIAVRLAIGASQWRVLRQMLTESVSLAFLGGFLGWQLALWGLPLFISLIPEDLPRLSEVRIDLGVLGFTLLASVLTGVLFGIAPALYAMRPDLLKTIHEGARGASAGGDKIRLRNILVVGEVAVTLVILIGAGLLATSLIRLLRVSPGFETRSILTLNYDYSGQKYDNPDKQAELVRRIQERISTVPGVEQVATTTVLPMSNANMGVGFNIQGRIREKKGSAYAESTGFGTVSPGYFGTLKIQMKSGRDFTERDSVNAPPVVIVNEAFVKKFFPNENPIGKFIDPSVSVQKGDPPMREIIGVVADIRQKGLAKAPEPMAFVSSRQIPWDSTLVVRTSVPPASLAKSVEAALREVDPELPVYNVKTLEQYLGADVARPQFNALLVEIFAGIALLQTMIGLYGVMAFSVAQRTREIGIRMALGAGSGMVLGLVVKQGLILTGIGISLGLGLAFLLTRTMESLLYGVTATDPLTFALVPVVLALTGILACLVPARRAAGVDPMEALRSE
jgi:putative ABC transport system permease protein